MFVVTVGVMLAIGLVTCHYDYSTSNRELPTYIKRALKQRNEFTALPRQKKKTISNLTLAEVLDKVKLITAALNRDAEKNGYFVDYKLKMPKQ